MSDTVSRVEVETRAAAPLVSSAADLAKKPRALSLRANFSWMFVGNVIYMACQWGQLIVLAKLSTAQAVGQFALGVAIGGPVIMFTNLQLRDVQVTDTRRQFLPGHYLALRVFSTVLGWLTILGIVLLSGYRTETGLIVLIVGLAKSFEAMSDLFYGLLQGQEIMDRIAKGMIIKGVLSLAVMGLLLAISGSVLVAVAGLAITWAGVLFCYDIPNAVTVIRQAYTPGAPGGGYRPWPAVLRPRWELRTLLRITRIALPLGLVMLLISLYTNIPRYFLDKYASERELGIFAALSYYMVAGRAVTASLGSSIMPRLAGYYANRRVRAYTGLVLKSVLLGAGIGVAGVLVSLLAGRTVLTLLYKPEYGRYADIFTWMMVIAGLRYIESFIQYGFTAARYFTVQMYLAALVTATTALGSVILIPGHGIEGATAVLMVSTVVKLVSSAAVQTQAMRKLIRREAARDSAA